MLQRRYRLFPHTSFANAKVTRMPLFTLKVIPNSTEHNRFGFVVSKKVSKSAVIRNTTKRIFRECIERHMAAIQSGYDMLFIINSALDKKTHAATCEQLITRLRGMRLLI